jgi:GNAT superfamily N-acetyltransferase
MAAALDRETSLRLQRRSLGSFIRFLGASSEEASLLELDGVTAAIVPACPKRSLVNSIVYEDAGALRDSLDEVAEAHRAAGVSTWLVWVPEFDDRAREVLADAGYGLSGVPAAMHADLDAIEAPEIGDLQWDDRASLSEVGLLNDLAYGLPASDGFAPCLSRVPDGTSITFYRAGVAGQTACVLAIIDEGEDAGVFFVATHRDFRRRGLSIRLMAVALAKARERGLRTSTLQSSAIGEPVYSRLGYERAYGLELWEYREPQSE